MKLSKIVKKILREQEEIEPIGGPTPSPNEFAYYDFKSWAYEVGTKELFRVKKFKVGDIEYTLEEATEMGAVVYPPIPAFYNKPDSIDDLIDHSVGRALEHLGFEIPTLKRWDGRN